MMAFPPSEVIQSDEREKETSPPLFDILKIIMHRDLKTYKESDRFFPIEDNSLKR
jgi:hypothetical protein